METSTAKSPIVTAAVGTETAERMSFWQTLEFNRFGIIPILLTVVGCIGGIAAGFGALNSILAISLVAFPTVIFLALLLAVAPMRVIVFSASIALLCDVVALAIGYPFAL